MQIEVEFVDEFGRDLVFPQWPGGERGMPGVSKLKPNRLMYTHAFLANAGAAACLFATIVRLANAFAFYRHQSRLRRQDW